MALVPLHSRAIARTRAGRSQRVTSSDWTGCAISRRSGLSEQWEDRAFSACQPPARRAGQEARRGYPGGMLDHESDASFLAYYCGAWRTREGVLGLPTTLLPANFPAKDFHPGNPDTGHDYHVVVHPDFLGDADGSLLPLLVRLSGRRSTTVLPEPTCHHKRTRPHSRETGRSCFRALVGWRTCLSQPAPIDGGLPMKQC